MQATAQITGCVYAIRIVRSGLHKYLEAGASPVVLFALASEKPVAAYAHGFWKVDRESKLYS